MPTHQGHQLVRKIRVLREQLATLERSLRGFAPMLNETLASARVNGAGSGRSRPRLSAKARASMVLQGRYMGYMRQLKPEQKAQVRKIREAKGVRVAIARARGLASAQH